MSNQKNVVEVVRYIRPLPFEWSVYGLYSNLYGITLVYTMDYESKQVAAKWSICNGDNFEKKLGVEVAKNSGVCVIFPMESIQENGGLTPALVSGLLEYLGTPSRDFYEMSDFVDKIELFLEATRKLKNS